MLHDLIAQAQAWEEQERPKKAIEYYEKAIALLSEARSSEDLALRGTCYRSLGTQWRLLGHHKQTGDAYRLAITDYEAAFLDVPDMKLAEMYYLLASFLEQLWKLELAQQYYKKSFDQLCFCLGDSHANTQKALLKYQTCLERYQDLRKG